MAITTLVLTLLGAACGDAAPDPGADPRGPGTRAMADRLAAMARQIDPRTNPYESSEVLRVLKRTPVPPGLRGRLTYHARLAQELLHAGRFDDAIVRFDSVLIEIEAHRQAVPSGFALAIRDLRAVTYLHRSMERNCVPPDATRRCSVPIREAYPEPEGARRAYEAYGRLLDEQSDDLIARWFLNVSAMALGEYPAGVPATRRIPPAAFASEHDVGRFREVAHALGVDVRSRAGGSIMDDFDGDGLLDLMTSSRGLRDQLRFFRNGGDGTFTDRTTAAGLDGLVGGLNLVPADYNNDGFLDVLVLRGAWLEEGHPNSLLRNNGDGTFEDVTEAAGLLEPAYPSQTAAWGDYDNDGWVDLFVGNETQGDTRHPSQLFRNNGDGTFEDVAPAAGVAAIGFIKAVAWGDYDNDGRLDLYISRLDAPNTLLHNEGPDAAGEWTFADATARAGVAEPTESFPAWFFDYDNDGWLDLFVAGRRGSTGDVTAEYLGLPHGAEPPRLYRNNGDGTFTDVTSAARLDRIMLAMGANYGDLDNDGYLDLYLGTGDPDPRALIPNRVFRNAAGRVFQDVTTSGGFGHLPKGHGIAFGDLDNDGDQDVYIALGAAYEGDVAHNALFENAGHDHRWITLRLAGTRSNRAAIGARVRITVDSGGRPREIHRMVGTGGSFGANSLQQEIGLGNAETIRTVQVTWPTSGETQTFTGLELDRIYDLIEGEPTATLVTLRRIRLPSPR